MYSKMNDISKKPKLIGRSYGNIRKCEHILHRFAMPSSRGFQRSSIRYADVEISRYRNLNTGPPSGHLSFVIEQEPSEVKVSRSDLKTRLGYKRLDLSLSNTSTCLFDFSRCLYRWIHWRTLTTMKNPNCYYLASRCDQIASTSRSDVCLSSLKSSVTYCQVQLQFVLSAFILASRRERELEGAIGK